MSLIFLRVQPRRRGRVADSEKKCLIVSCGKHRVEDPGQFFFLNTEPVSSTTIRTSHPATCPFRHAIRGNFACTNSIARFDHRGEPLQPNPLFPFSLRLRRERLNPSLEFGVLSAPTILKQTRISLRDPRVRLHDHSWLLASADWMPLKCRVGKPRTYDCFCLRDTTKKSKTMTSEQCFGDVLLTAGKNFRSIPMSRL